MEYICYTDGAASGNGRDDCIAGWAFVILDETNTKIAEGSGRIENGTNNIGELRAIIEAVKASANLMTGLSDTIVIHSDSAYCINGITNWRYGWKKNDWYRDKQKKLELKNREMWKELDSLIDSFRMDFQKCAGHSGVEWNEYVDKMAVKMTRGDNHDKK